MKFKFAEVDILVFYLKFAGESDVTQQFNLEEVFALAHRLDGEISAFRTEHVLGRLAHTIAGQGHCSETKWVPVGFIEKFRCNLLSKCLRTEKRQKDEK